MGLLGTSVRASASFMLLLVLCSHSQAFVEDRCKDDTFCKAFCLSTNQDTVSARCGQDMQSCICMTRYNQPVKVRFIEERRPVPPTPSTTTTLRPVQQDQAVHYVNSQPYNGNGNSIVGSQYQTQPQQDHLTPVLLECDASESSTRMCHSFCTMEIRAWYGLCNITSKACACFGIPPSAVQKDPIAAIFYSTAPVATPAPTTPRPRAPPQLHPHPFPQQQQQPQHFQQPHQQQWKPIPPSPQYQQPYGNYPYPAGPSVLHPAPHNNQLQDLSQAPVRSVAGMFGTNGKPVSPTILTPSVSQIETHSSQQLVPSTDPNLSSFAANANSEDNEGATSELPVTESNPTTTTAQSSVSMSRRRRSLNDTPLIRGKDVASNKDVSMKAPCTKFKCGIACKRSNYMAPDCEPKCFDGQCMCECTPTN